MFACANYFEYTVSVSYTHLDVYKRQIVDSYFMPYGIESDQYAILGEILDCRLEQNNLTGENV